MSSPLARTNGADDLSLYAPKWAAGAPRRSETPIDDIRLDVSDWSATEPVDPPAVEPTVVPQPAARPRVPMLGRLAFAGVAAAVVALVLVTKMPGWSVTAAGGPAAGGLAAGRAETARTAANHADSSFASRFAGHPAAALASDRPPGQEARLRTAGHAMPSAHRVTTEVVSRTSAPEQPLAPRPASLPNQGGLPSQGSQPSQASLPSQDRVPRAARELNAEEISVLIRRGEELFASGDIAAARVVLRRAAEAQDARGALALAATYDPLLLSKLVVAGGADGADVAAARAWYEKAKAFGSEDATRRLEQLASRAR